MRRRLPRLLASGDDLAAQRSTRTPESGHGPRAATALTAYRASAAAHHQDVRTDGRGRAGSGRWCVIAPPDMPPAPATSMRAHEWVPFTRAKTLESASDQARVRIATF